MKIEIGRYYETRKGVTVGPVVHDQPDGHYYVENHGLVTNDGVFGYIEDGVRKCSSRENDLIKAVYPNKGTLEQINAKPGDWVAFVCEGDNKSVYVYPDKGSVWVVRGDNTVYGCSPELCNATWRVVSRAPDGPVRTVTRKDVVPGVYGHIWIDRVDGDIAVIGMLNNALKKMDTVGMSAGEIRAAAETMIQIADALEQK